ncbi:MAG: c-type cytochrome [Pirellulaceae bacterium]|nr:c-type cytochrome [Pirellulaceae bacterium]
MIDFRKPPLLLSVSVSLLLCSRMFTAAAADDFPPVVNSQDPADRPPSSQEAAAAITVPEGFRVTLFAGEPDVAQPIAFDLDDRGRLWVVECYTYDSRNFSQQFRDRVLIFDDTDNDGRFDVRRVFWDRDRCVTGIAIGFGGVWLLADRRLIVIPDENRDDVPDGEPRIMLDGFDNGPVGHNVVNGLLWGPDGWLYGRHGIQATSLVGPPGAADYDRQRLNCSIWRYHPVRHEFEVVTHGTTNPWGLDYNDFGEFFFTNNVIGHLWHVVPGAHYRRMYGDDFRQHLYHLIDQCADHYHWDTGQNWAASRDGVGKHGELGGGHAHCGGMIYLGDNWPERYRNAMFTCNVHGRRVNQDRLERHGSGYAGRHEPDFLFANQPWFRGVELKYGPDGGVYLADWTDLGECHDHDGVHRTSGRIYKVVHGDSPPKQAVDVASATNDQLVDWQSHRNDWFVRRARRVLQERAAAGQDLSAIHARLLDLFGQHPDATRRLRAMWALYSTDGVDDDWLLERLEDEHEAVRAWAVRLLTDRDPPSPAVSERLAQRAAVEASGLVRLHLASALRRLPLPARWPLASALGSHGEDAYDTPLRMMIWYGIEPAVVDRPASALQLAEHTRIPVLRLFIARRLTTELDRTPQPVDRLLQLAAASDSLDFQRDILEGMSEALRGWRQATPPASWTAAQGALQRRGDDRLTALIRELALVFGDGRAMDELRSLAGDASKPPELRRRALESLIENRPADLAPLLIRLARDRAVDSAAIRGLAAYNDPETPQVVLQQMERLDADGRRECINTLCARPTFAVALLEAVGRGQVARSEISAYHARQLASLNDSQVDRLLLEHWGAIRETSAEKAELVHQFKERLTDRYLSAADMSNGRLVFKTVCANCHRLYGQGEQIGPDLTGSNRDNLDYLFNKLVDPSASVPQDYRISTIFLADGRVLAGIVGAATDRTIQIQMQDQRLTIHRDDIEEIVPSTLSLMPEGLLKPLDDVQIRDLIAYLRGQNQVPLPTD